MSTKNQFVDTAALFKRLDRQARKWLAEWQPVVPKNHQRNTDLLKNYLAGQEQALMLDAYCQYLAIDRYQQFEIDGVLEGTLRWEHLALSARHDLCRVLVAATWAEADSLQLGPTPAGIARLLSEVILAGWRGHTRLLLEALLQGMGNALLELYGNRLNEATQFYFLIQLGVEHFGLELPPQEVFRFARPQDMPEYAAVLADWRTPDLARVQALVSAMAEHHVRASKGSDGFVGAFSLQSDYLFPYEILAFLRLREWEGLENPVSFDHPLMNTPLAVLPPAPLPWPEAPLLDAAIAKFKTEYPERNYFYIDRLTVPV